MLFLITDGGCSKNRNDESQEVNMTSMTGSYMVTMSRNGCDQFVPQDSLDECQIGDMGFK